MENSWEVQLLQKVDFWELQAGSDRLQALGQPPRAPKHLQLLSIKENDAAWAYLT